MVLRRLPALEHAYQCIWHQESLCQAIVAHCHISCVNLWGLIRSPASLSASVPRDITPTAIHSADPLMRCLYFLGRNTAAHHCLICHSGRGKSSVSLIFSPHHLLCNCRDFFGCQSSPGHSLLRHPQDGTLGFREGEAKRKAPSHEGH